MSNHWSFSSEYCNNGAESDFTRFYDTILIQVFDPIMLFIELTQNVLS
jgi:hypothetical protein